MRDLRAVFDYQKFSLNDSLQAKIDMVTEKYLSGGVELADADLDVAAAGEPQQSELFLEKEDANKG